VDESTVLPQWQFLPNEIPSDACHLVFLLETYDCVTPNKSFCHNLRVVTTLEEGGRKMSGWESTYFATHQMADWLKIGRGRNTALVDTTKGD
jgi:hypothetical protein